MNENGTKPNLWRQKSTDITFEFKGEERDDEGVPFAVMKEGPLTIRVDPLDLMKIDGDWEKV